jgi:L-rhamnose mutarotase
VGEDILQRAKVGVFGIGLEAYWNQFGGLRDRLEDYRRSVEERIGQWATVVSPGLVDTAPQAYAAAEGGSLPGPTLEVGNTNSRLRFVLPPAAFSRAGSVSRSSKSEGARGQMAHYAWILEVRPGYEEEYVRRHQEIWPEMVEALRSAGISNYSIYRHGLTLFGYFETDDIEESQKYLANSETNQRWSEWMDPIMKVDIDPTTQFPYLLPLQWHMD